MHREPVSDRAPGKPSAAGSPSVQQLAPGKRTLTESLVVQHRESATISDAELAASGTVASAPAPLLAPAIGGPRPPLQMLFGVQRAASAEGPAQVQAAAMRGTATPISTLPYADQIQRAFGRHDISGIQAHVGGDAAASARDMGARAYATGDHVVLGEGADLHTVAHEAAHVVQQRGGVQLKGGVGEVGDAYERHADEVADRVVQGKSAEPLLDPFHQFHGPPAAGAGGVQMKKASGTMGAAPSAATRLPPVRNHRKGGGASKRPAKIKRPTGAVEVTTGAAGGVQKSVQRKEIVGTKYSEVRPTQMSVHPDIVDFYAKALQSGAELPSCESYTASTGGTFLEEGHHRFAASHRVDIAIGRTHKNSGGPTGPDDWSEVKYEKFLEFQDWLTEKKIPNQESLDALISALKKFESSKSDSELWEGAANLEARDFAYLGDLKLSAEFWKGVTEEAKAVLKNVFEAYDTKPYTQDVFK